MLILLSVAGNCDAQKLIEYSSGMGSRDPQNADIWILYRGVKARHEGMTLQSDSAHYNTKEKSGMKATFFLKVVYSNGRN